MPDGAVPVPASATGTAASGARAGDEGRRHGEEHPAHCERPRYGERPIASSSPPARSIAVAVSTSAGIVARRRCSPRATGRTHGKPLHLFHLDEHRWRHAIRAIHRDPGVPPDGLPAVNERSWGRSPWSRGRPAPAGRSSSECLPGAPLISSSRVCTAAVAIACDGLAHGGQRRVGEGDQRRVVEPDHRHVARAPTAPAPGTPGSHPAPSGREAHTMPVQPRSSSCAGRRLTALHREQRVRDQLVAPRRPPATAPSPRDSPRSSGSPARTGPDRPPDRSARAPDPPDAVRPAAPPPDRPER